MMAVFFIGAAFGSFVTALVANQIWRAQERWFDGRLNYWSERVTEMQEQRNSSPRPKKK